MHFEQSLCSKGRVGNCCDRHLQGTLPRRSGEERDWGILSFHEEGWGGFNGTVPEQKQKTYLFWLRSCQITGKRRNSGCCIFILGRSWPHARLVRDGKPPQLLPPACLSWQQSEVCCTLRGHIFSASLCALFALSFPYLFFLLVFFVLFTHVIVLLPFPASSLVPPSSL